MEEISKTISKTNKVHKMNRHRQVEKSKCKLEN